MPTVMETHQNDHLVEAFLDDMRADNRSAATTRAYGSDLRDFLRHYDGPIEAVGTDTIRGYLRQLEEAQRAATTRARRRVAITAFLDWCVREGHLVANPARRLPRFKLPDLQPRTPAISDVERVLDAITDKRDRLLFTLIVDTGLRISEALAIRLEDIRIGAQEITVMGKGQRQRTIYLIKVEAFKLLKAYLREQKWLAKDGETLMDRGLLFRPDPAKQRRGLTGKPLDYSVIRRRWAKWCKAVDADLDIHQLRHAYATKLINEGKPVEVVQKVLGHRNLQTTMRYANVSDETVRRALSG